jgi:hypothetical protein
MLSRYERKTIHDWIGFTHERKGHGNNTHAKALPMHRRYAVLVNRSQVGRRSEDSVEYGFYVTESVRRKGISVKSVHVNCGIERKT